MHDLLWFFMLLKEKQLLKHNFSKTFQDFKPDIQNFCHPKTFSKGHVIYIQINDFDMGLLTYQFRILVTYVLHEYKGG